MCTAWPFSYAGQPLCTQILPGQGRPHQPFLASETRDARLPDSGDSIPLRSLVLTKYQSVTDRRSGRRICHNIYTVFQKKTSTHIVGYKLRNSCLILIIFDTEIPDII